MTTILDGRLACGSRDVGRKTGDAHFDRADIRYHLDEPNGSLGEREHEPDVRERHGPEQRLEMESVGDLDQVDEVVREPERRERIRRDEDRKAPRLVMPEGVVIRELVDGLVEGGEVGAIGPCELELPLRLGREVLQLDPLGVTVRGRVVQR